MQPIQKFLASFPFLSAAFVQAALALVVALGFHLTAGQTGTIEAAAAAVLALLMAPTVKPFPVPLFTGALTAIGALLIAFKVPHISSGEVAAIVAALTALLGNLGHVAVTNKVLAGERARAKLERQQI
jgi:hypothetical protein